MASGLMQGIFLPWLTHNGGLGFATKEARRDAMGMRARPARCRAVRKEDTVYRVQRLRNAAREGGFIEVNGSAQGSVLWLRKNKPDSGRDTYQRMCLDGLTASATVYWTDLPGKINSKTFRGVPALEEWLKATPESFAQR